MKNKVILIYIFILFVSIFLQNQSDLRKLESGIILIPDLYCIYKPISEVHSSELKPSYCPIIKNSNFRTSNDDITFFPIKSIWIFIPGENIKLKEFPSSEILIAGTFINSLSFLSILICILLICVYFYNRVH